VASEAEHAHVHPAAAADDRDVRGNLAIDERATGLDERTLPIEPEVLLQVKRAGGNLHKFIPQATGLPQRTRRTQSKFVF
jgi:hypothetical protein